MLWKTLSSAAAVLAACAVNATPLDGRWEGWARVPGAAQPLVLDLEGGRGSVTLPGRGVSGAPLRDLRQSDTAVSASLAAAIPAYGASAPAPAVELALRADGRLAGRFNQAGWSAPLELQRTGAAQVAPAPAGTAIDPALAGTWRGRYELDGVPREVTLVLAATQPASATLVIVGKRRVEVPVDRVAQGPAYLTLESSEFGLVVEGRVGHGVIDGTLQQGPFDLPLRLVREGGGS
ncbi:MAG: hypothetical protein U1F50_07845 [Rubrivivax sp.]